MITIAIHSTTPADTGTASRTLQALASSWGHPSTQAPPAADPQDPRDAKTIDPVALTTLIVSIPSAALAVLDLADRITKRRRASELIQHAQHLATRHITLTLTIPARTIELATLTPDQLLDLTANQHPDS